MGEGVGGSGDRLARARDPLTVCEHRCALALAQGRERPRISGADARGRDVRYDRHSFSVSAGGRSHHGSQERAGAMPFVGMVLPMILRSATSLEDAYERES